MIEKAGPILADTPVEELVAAHPRAIRFLAEREILCVVCGEPFWGTLGELIGQREDLDAGQILAELNAYLAGSEPGEQPE